MIILDTNVISEPLRQNPRSEVLAWLDAQVIETLFLTAISLAEVRYGIASLTEGKRKRTLLTGFEDELLPLFAGRILPFDEGSSRSYADLRATARANGTALGDFDALMAAMAKQHGFAVATRDTSPFEAAGISVINPLEAE